MYLVSNTLQYSKSPFICYYLIKMNEGNVNAWHGKRKVEFDVLFFIWDAAVTTAWFSYGANL